MFATTIAIAGYLGGFAVGQRTNEESFKTVCSQVVDQAMKKFERHRNTTTKNGRPPANNHAASTTPPISH